MQMFVNKLSILSLVLMALSTLNGLAITGSGNNEPMRKHESEDHGDTNLNQNGAPSINNNQGSAPPSIPKSKEKFNDKSSNIKPSGGGSMLSGIPFVGDMLGGGGGDKNSGSGSMLSGIPFAGDILGGGGGKKSGDGSMLSGIPIAGDLIGGILPF